MEQEKSVNCPIEQIAPELLSKIVHLLSHDIGNPLTSIITYGSLIEQAETLKIPSDKLSGYAKSMLLETWKISNLMEKFLLLVSKKESGGLVKLKDLGSKIMSRYQSRYGLNSFDLELSGFDSSIQIKGDAEQLCGIFCELLINAANAIKDLSSTENDLEHSLIIKADSSNPSQITFTIENFTLQRITPLEELMKIGVTECPISKPSIGIGLPAVLNSINRWNGQFSIEQTCKNEKYNFKSTIVLPIVLSE